LTLNGLHSVISQILTLFITTAVKTSNLTFKCLVIEITEFQKIADGFIFMVDSLAKEVEKEKMKAIGARNLLKSVAKQREAERQQLQVRRARTHGNDSGHSILMPQ
jgi:intraflagellar transport protein 20